MNFKKRTVTSFLFLFIILPCISFAADPILYFSDLTSGPKSGLNDGKGEGAIVTVWGQNLGSAQRQSHIYFKDSSGATRPAAFVYYWENADPGNGNSGPANLYKYHKMQEIAFSIPGSAAGEGVIYVVVDGKTSNELPFTVRDGNIYYVAPAASGGSDSKSGSYSSPWGTFDGLSSKVDFGDVIYFLDGWTSSERCTVSGKSGTSDSPIFVSSYPGATAICQGSSSGIANFSNENEYWSISKFVIKSDNNGVNSFKGQRVVGNEVTDINCANGQSAALTQRRAQADNNAYFGNWIHDFGCSSKTSRLHHTTYFTNRSGEPVSSPEVAWNLLEDNQARNGMHFYDENSGGDWNTTLKIHDNIIINQVATCIDVSFNKYTDTNYTMDGEIYNNLCVGTGQASELASGQAVIIIDGTVTKGHYKIYNNTIYGYYGNFDENGGQGCAIKIPTSFGGTYEFTNNIIVDTRGVPFFDTIPGQKTPTSAVRNIWYTTKGMPSGYGAPTWDESWEFKTSNPKFKDPGAYDFTLQPDSPAIDNGSDSVSSIVKHDLLGNERGKSSSDNDKYDIGAYEFFRLWPTNLRFETEL